MSIFGALTHGAFCDLASLSPPHKGKGGSPGMREPWRIGASKGALACAPSATPRTTHNDACDTPCLPCTTFPLLPNGRSGAPAILYPACNCGAQKVGRNAPPSSYHTPCKHFLFLHAVCDVL